MFPVDIQFVKTHDKAVLPKYNHSDPYIGDSGLDVTAVEDAIIPYGGSAVVPVGLKLAYVTPGYWFRVEGRSGLGFKHSIAPHFGAKQTIPLKLVIRLHNLLSILSFKQM